jgi:hypothetical protein
MNEPLPLARKESLIIKELADETLVYDTRSDKAHCLNPTAALVWKNCDGKRTVDQLRELMESDAGTAVPEEMIWLALDQLKQFSLLETTVNKPSYFASMSRRQMVRLATAAAIAAPVIFSIVAPGAAEAQSKVPPGGCCTTNSNCISNNCANGGTCPPPSKICMP